MVKRPDHLTKNEVKEPGLIAPYDTSNIIAPGFVDKSIPKIELNTLPKQQSDSSTYAGSTAPIVEQKITPEVNTIRKSDESYALRSIDNALAY